MTSLIEFRLTLALEAAQLGTWTWDMAAGTTTWDVRLEELHGLPPGGFGGTFEDWLASLHPEDRAECLAGRTGAREPGTIRTAPPHDLARRLGPLHRVPRNGPDRRGRRAHRHHRRGHRCDRSGAAPGGHVCSVRPANAISSGSSNRRCSRRRCLKYRARRSVCAISRPGATPASVATGTQCFRSPTAGSAWPSGMSPATVWMRSPTWRPRDSACVRSRSRIRSHPSACSNDSTTLYACSRVTR